MHHRTGYSPHPIVIHKTKRRQRRWQKRPSTIRLGRIDTQCQGISMTLNMLKSSGIVNLQPHRYRLTLNTTLAMILGQSVEGFNHELGGSFSKAFKKTSLITVTRVRLGDLYFSCPKGGFHSLQDLQTLYGPICQRCPAPRPWQRREIK